MNITEDIPVIGHKYMAIFGENRYLLNFISEKQIQIKLIQGMGKDQVVNCNRVLIRPNVYMVTWQEGDNSTVTHLEDFAKGIVYSNITMPDNTFYNYKGTLELADEDNTITNT